MYFVPIFSQIPNQTKLVKIILLLSLGRGEEKVNGGCQEEVTRTRGAPIPAALCLLSRWPPCQLPLGKRCRSENTKETQCLRQSWVSAKLTTKCSQGCELHIHLLIIGLCSKSFTN